jgi:glycosyltransferase involved in cell wall biosynthesis
MDLASGSRDVEMNILVCTSEYPPDFSSGIGRVAQSIVSEMRRMGHVCTVCSPSGPDIKIGSAKLIKETGILGLLYFWCRVTLHFRRDKNGYDIAWVHNPLYLLHDPFRRSLVTIHTTYYGRRTKKFRRGVYDLVASVIERYCLARVSQRARFTSADSQVTKEMTNIGIGVDRIAHIRNGVDTKVIRPRPEKADLRKEFGISKGDLAILSVGRLTEVKQPLELIRVLAIVEKEMKDVILLVVGGGELLQKSISLARELKMKRIRFLGPVSYADLSNLYASCDVYVIPSKYEGQPLALLEAMASGLPCIVSDIPNLEIVKEANCGLVVDFDNTIGAAADIVRFLHSDRSVHQTNAREYAVRNLDWSVASQEITSILENMVK